MNIQSTQWAGFDGLAGSIRLARLVGLTAAVGALIACGGVDATSIKANRDAMDGQVVTLEGTVLQVKSVSRGGPHEGATIYLLHDGSGELQDGSIWVYRGKDSTVNSIPQPRTKVSLRAKVESEMMIMKKNYSPILIEIEAEETVPAFAVGSPI